jgi:hypothetical protein
MNKNYFEGQNLLTTDISNHGYLTATGHCIFKLMLIFPFF